MNKKQTYKNIKAIVSMKRSRIILYILFNNIYYKDLYEIKIIIFINCVTFLQNSTLN